MVAYEDEQETSENIEPEVGIELAEADSTEETPEDVIEGAQQDPDSNE